MGGEGSGRKPSAETIVARLSAPTQASIAPEQIIIPNYSGVKKEALTRDDSTLLTGGAYSLPAVDGNNGEALVTNGAGVVSWSAVASSTDVGYLDEQSMKQAVDILQLQAASSVTPMDYDTMFVDVFSDSSGYDNTIDTGAATTASYDAVTDVYRNFTDATDPTLIHYYKFNEANGNTSADAGSGAAANLSGLAGTFAAGKLNNGYTPNNEAVDCGFTLGAIDTSQAWSFSGWMKPTGSITQYSRPISNSDAGYVSSNGEFDVYTDTNNVLKLDIYDNVGHKSINTTTQMNSGTWYNFALTCDGTNVKFYINGSQEGSTATLSGFNIDNEATNVFLFGNSAGLSKIDNCMFDDVRFYNKALSGAEVSAIYNSGTPSESGGLSTPANSLVQTNTITIPGNATAYQLYATKAVAGSGSVQFKISFDNGASFSAAKELNTKYTNAVAGTSLKVQILLNGVGEGNTATAADYALLVWV